MPLDGSSLLQMVFASSGKLYLLLDGWSRFYMVRNGSVRSFVVLD